MDIFASMEIKIWNNKYANEMYDYKEEEENPNGFKKLFFNFEKKDKDCFLIKTFDNKIEILYDHSKFKSDKGDELLFKIRKSLKKNNLYEIINPIKEHKINSIIFDNNLNFKIWYPTRSLNNFVGNIQNYNLNINDIIKLGKKMYIINKIHFANEEKIENIKDNDFNNNNNISDISSINKISKSIFNIDLKSNEYKINNNENLKKINEENEVKEINDINKANDINEQKFKNSIQNYNKNNSNIKNEIINTKKNLNNRRPTQVNIQKESKNAIYNQKISTNLTSNAQNDNRIEDDSENEDENKNVRCHKCKNSNCDENNPLISLCNCGNFIHYECLKMDLNSNIIVTENSKRTVTTYTCEKFNCNKCLKPYQLRFRIPKINKIYELIDLTLPEELDYICFESLDYIKDDNNIKIIHISHLTGEDINIGRSIYNDIIDNDLSVSRDHAVLKYDKFNQNLFLENKNGKYGTLVLVRGNIKINQEKTYIQIGNTKISMELTNKNNFNNVNKEGSDIIQ